MCRSLRWAVLVATGFADCPLQAGVFMVGDENGVLWRVNPVSGAAEPVGDMGVVMTDIAFAPSGDLYGISYTDLYRINPATAAVIEHVGPIAIGGQANALEFDRSGTLYVASIQSWSQGQLGTIDLATRQTTVLGSIGYPSDGDLAAAPDGTLLMSSCIIGGLIPQCTNDRLVRIDPTATTGRLATPIGLTGFTYTHGMDFVGDRLIGTTLAGKLISIDTATGAAALIANTNPTVRAYGASYTEFPAPPPQPRFESHLPEPTGARNLILVTHGWNPTGEDRVAWVDVMAEVIRTRVDASEWEVVAYQWTDEAHTFLPDVALYHGFQQGSLEGGVLAGRNYDHVHLIGNSAGAALVDGIAQQINLYSPHTTIHTTFLDAYASPWVVPWVDHFGASSDWSDQYFNVGDLPSFPPFLSVLTETVLDNAHNFDLTNLNPLPEDPYFGHQWPRTWYFDTILDMSGSQHYGFPLSYEGGNWDPNQYAKGQVTILGVGQPSKPIEYVVQWAGQYLDLQAGMYVVSPTGVVQFSPNGLSMQTDSPVWLIAEIDIEGEVDLLRFDLEFTSAAGAEGLLAVYFDDYSLGKVEERFVPNGIQQLVFELDDPLPGSHALSLRLDSFSDVPSSILISSLEWGSVQVVPEPSTFVLTVLTLLCIVALCLRHRFS